MEPQIRRAENENVSGRTMKSWTTSRRAVQSMKPGAEVDRLEENGCPSSGRLCRKWFFYPPHRRFHLRTSLTRSRDKLHNIQLRQLNQSVERNPTGHNPVLRSYLRHMKPQRLELLQQTQRVPGQEQLNIHESGGSRLAAPGLLLPAIEAFEHCGTELRFKERALLGRLPVGSRRRDR